MSIATRTGATKEVADSSIRSSCSALSTITTGASSGCSAVIRASRVRPAASAVG